MQSRVFFFFGCLLLTFLLAGATFAPLIASFKPNDQNLERDLLAPSSEHLMGTDKLGRDILSRVLHGSRVSLMVGVTTVIFSLMIGIMVGFVSGYRGGWTDLVCMRLVDILLAFPGILLAIAITAALGPSLTHVVLALSVIGWTGYARLVRGEILALKERDFIRAAQGLGAGPLRILISHILPNVLPPLLIQATFGISAAIMAEGGLSFLGLGAQPPTPSWGSMLSEGRQFLLVAPHLTVFPGLAMMMTVLATNLVGDGIRDLLEKRGK